VIAFSKCFKAEVSGFKHGIYIMCNNQILHTFKMRRLTLIKNDIGDNRLKKKKNVINSGIVTRESEVPFKDYERRGFHIEDLGYTLMEG